MTRQSISSIFFPILFILVFILYPGLARSQNLDYNGYPVAQVVVLGNQKVAKKAILDILKKTQ